MQKAKNTYINVLKERERETNLSYWGYYTNKSVSVLLVFSQEYLKYKWRNENHDHDISFLFN
jgi:hypothetical protein